MLWEHEPQASVSTAISNSPKLSRVFLELYRNKENMFSISFRKHRDRKKKRNLLTLIIKMLILFASAIITSTARASSLFLLSFSINLLAFYHECRSLIGYATHVLFCDR